MNKTLSESAQQAEEILHSHIIKNTFIEVVNRRDASSRRGSTPASLRLFLESLPASHEQSDESTAFLDNEDADVSTTTSQSPLWSPSGASQSNRKCSDLSSSLLWSQADSLQSTRRESDLASSLPWSAVGSLESTRRGSDISSALPWSPAGSLECNRRDSDLSSSLPWSPVGSLQSNGTGSGTSSQHIVRSGNQGYKAKAQKLVKRVVKILGSCDLLAHVEATYSFQDCCISVKVNGDESMIDEASSLIKKTLLDVSSESKCIYIMGYCSDKAFVEHPRGFEATLGAMENATKACWHVFKKGFCRHDVNCSKQHPVYKMPLRVVIDAARPKTPAVEVCAPLSDFNLLLAGLVHTLASALEQSPHIASVRTREDLASGSWTVQLHPQSSGSQQEACVLTVARNHLLTLINSSKVVQIVEHAGWSFVPKPNGFVALLGEKSRILESATNVVPLSFVVKSAPIELD